MKKIIDFNPDDFLNFLKKELNIPEKEAQKDLEYFLENKEDILKRAVDNGFINKNENDLYTLTEKGYKYDK